MKRQIKPIALRFWSKVQKSPICWIWIAGLDGHGYAQFSIRHRHRPANRVAGNWNSVKFRQAWKFAMNAIILCVFDLTISFWGRMPTI